MNELLQGGIYVNVHTAKFGGGEIRSQVRLTTGIGRTATFTGAQEVPPVNTPATGTGSCVLTSAGVEFDATVEGLLGTLMLAHFHNAPAGMNGPVVKTITPNFTGFTATGLWAAGDPEPLTPALVGTFLSGGQYLNVHTSMFGGGEIRGQLMAPNVVGIGPVESAPSRAFLAQNIPNPFNPTTAIRYELTRAEHVTLRLYDVTWAGDPGAGRRGAVGGTAVGDPRRARTGERGVLLPAGDAELQRRAEARPRPLTTAREPKAQGRGTFAGAAAPHFPR